MKLLLVIAILLGPCDMASLYAIGLTDSTLLPPPLNFPDLASFASSWALPPSDLHVVDIAELTFPAAAESGSIEMIPTPRPSGAWITPELRGEELGDVPVASALESLNALALRVPEPPPSITILAGILFVLALKKVKHHLQGLSDEPRERSRRVKTKFRLMA